MQSGIDLNILVKFRNGLKNKNNWLIADSKAQQYLFL